MMALHWIRMLTMNVMNTYCWGRRFLWPGMNGTYTILTPWLTMVTSNPYLSCGDKGENKMSKTSMSQWKSFLKMQYQCTGYKKSTRGYMNLIGYIYLWEAVLGNKHSKIIPGSLLENSLFLRQLLNQSTI